MVNPYLRVPISSLTFRQTAGSLRWRAKPLLLIHPGLTPALPDVLHAFSDTAKDFIPLETSTNLCRPSGAKACLAQHFYSAITCFGLPHIFCATVFALVRCSFQSHTAYGHSGALSKHSNLVVPKDSSCPGRSRMLGPVEGTFGVGDHGDLVMGQPKRQAACILSAGKNGGLMESKRQQCWDPTAQHHKIRVSPPGRQKHHRLARHRSAPGSARRPTAAIRKDVHRALLLDADSRLGFPFDCHP